MSSPESIPQSQPEAGSLHDASILEQERLKNSGITNQMSGRTLREFRISTAEAAGWTPQLGVDVSTTEGRQRGFKGIVESEDAIKSRDPEYRSNIEIIEARRNSSEVQQLNNMVEIELYGSRGRTVYRPEDVAKYSPAELKLQARPIATPEEPMVGLLERMRTPAFGQPEKVRKRQARKLEREARDYEKEILSYVEDGFELCQAKLIADMKRASARAKQERVERVDALEKSLSSVETTSHEEYKPNRRRAEDFLDSKAQDELLSLNDGKIVEIVRSQNVFTEEEFNRVTSRKPEPDNKVYEHSGVTADKNEAREDLSHEEKRNRLGEDIAMAAKEINNTLLEIKQKESQLNDPNSTLGNAEKLAITNTIQKLRDNLSWAIRGEAGLRDTYNKTQKEHKTITDDVIAEENDALSELIEAKMLKGSSAKKLTPAEIEEYESEELPEEPASRLDRARKLVIKYFGVKEQRKGVRFNAFGDAVISPKEGNKTVIDSSTRRAERAIPGSTPAVVMMAIGFSAVRSITGEKTPDFHESSILRLLPKQPEYPVPGLAPKKPETTDSADTNEEGKKSAEDNGNKMRLDTEKILDGTVYRENESLFEEFFKLTKETIGKDKKVEYHDAVGRIRAIKADSKLSEAEKVIQIATSQNVIETMLKEAKEMTKLRPNPNN